MYGILQKGELLACGSFEELWQKADCRIWAGVRLKEGAGPVPGMKEQDGWWRKAVDSEEEMPGILEQLIRDGNSVYEARLFYPELEEVYFRYLEGNVPDGKAGETK